ncbi:transposase family protein [Streptomyces sp. NBC_01361]|uniref:transposase family protein n=1 Tax=Streptomyces sp. NBC_01361 TaxID=2903838 RepID=UPI003FCD0BCD
MKLAERSNAAVWTAPLLRLASAEKEANRVLAAGRVPVERGFAHLKSWRILTKLRTDPARAPTCFARCSC